MPKSVSEIVLKIEDEIIDALAHFDGWYDKLKAIVKIVTPVIEELYTSFRGADKKVEATKIINELINRHVKIPFFLKPLQGFLVSKAIDTVVAHFNKIGVFKKSK